MGLIVVYGSCIEPEGLELGDEHAKARCPECQYEAAEVVLYWRAEGSLNQYQRWNCPACGYCGDSGTP